jgi:hypothetical protein
MKERERERDGREVQKMDKGIVKKRRRSDW